LFSLARIPSAKAFDAGSQRMLHPFWPVPVGCGDRDDLDRLDDADNNRIDGRDLLPADIPVLRFPLVTAAHERP